MDLILVRIDDRLIHGQITVGWAQVLHPNRILLANDAVALNPTQKRLYEAVVPPEISISILTMDETAQRVENGTFDAGKTFLIVESPKDVLALQQRGLDIRSVNVGGLHFSEGKRRLLPYVFVSEQDMDDFRELIDGGIELECRDVPSAKKVKMKDLL